MMGFSLKALRSPSRMATHVNKCAIAIVWNLVRSEVTSRRPEARVACIFLN
jgi:hypothetical protein